jgi:hypothetical protein
MAKNAFFLQNLPLFKGANNAIFEREKAKKHHQIILKMAILFVVDFI